MKKHVSIIATLISLLLSSLVVISIWLGFQFSKTTTQDYVYIVAPGDSLKKISQHLEQEHIIPHAYVFTLLAIISNDAQSIQAGEYLFEKNSTLSMLLNKMVKGEVVMHHVRIGEGWTFAQIAQQIQNTDALKKTLDWTQPNTILQQLALSDKLPEGMFYPETYTFPRGFTDAQLLTLAYNDMQHFLKQAWQMRDFNIPYQDPYQALIVASIIEKETAIQSELAEISGVVVRRLQKSMLLQLDPSVVYGLGADYTKPLTKADLKFDTPYNTYMHIGLPPTPIATPSRAAIIAALHPNAGNTLYFVAKGDGSHVFSETLVAHELAVQQYRQQNQ